MSDNILQTSNDEVEDSKLFSVITSKEKLFTYTHDTHGFNQTLKIKLPTLKQRDTAEMLYNKYYNKLLKDQDHLTMKELLDLAEKRGLWTEDDKSKLATIDEEIVKLKDLVDSEKAKKKKDELAEKLATARAEKFRIAMRVGQLTSSAIENIAEKERTIFLLKNCVVVVEDNGKEIPLYPTDESIQSETDFNKLGKIVVDAKGFWSGEGLSDFFHLDG